MRKFFSSLIHALVRATILSQEFIPLEERQRLLRLHEERWREEEKRRRETAS